jgi:MFS family permease
MIANSKNVRRIYYLLTLLQTLAASFIWGINTLFLLDAGLSNTTAFAANAFFTAGEVLFEVPTGVVADTRGRRTSYALGAGTLLLTTILYYWLWAIHGPFWAWALVSALLGLGFTFFSGATEAWLVDALKATNYDGSLDSVFARGQTISGAAMLTGSVAGGLIAQTTNLGVPYLIRSGFLLLTLIVSLVFMRDWGFIPQKSTGAIKQIKQVLHSTMENGWRNSPVKWIMLASPFTLGVSFYVFYAMQPYLLKLYGHPHSYAIAGMAAAIVAGAQIVGGLLSNSVRKFFKKRTTILLTAVALSTAAIALLGFVQNFWAAIILLVVWGLLFALSTPIRQAYINGMIESSHRATVLSFDSLMGSSGGVIIQPTLGRAADSFGYPISYIFSAGFQILALPFIFLSRKQKSSSDNIEKNK